MSQMPPTVSAFLNTPYELSNDQIAYFKENGFIKLKQVDNHRRGKSFKQTTIGVGG